MKVGINEPSLSAEHDQTGCSHTLGHLNGSSFFNIHHRNLPIAPFNSELNSAYFWLKNSGLHEKLACCPLGHLGDLFFSTQLPSSVFTGNTIQVVIIWEIEVFVM